MPSAHELTAGPRSIDSTFITIDELSALLKIPKKTLYNWVSRNQIPYIKMGGHLRFAPREVVDFFSSKTEEARRPCLGKHPRVTRNLSWSLKSREEAGRCQGTKEYGNG
jgi:excisionase family DNA binding protein